MKICIFSTLKPMLPEFIVEQTNALRSWKKLKCKPKIIIIGDDEGVKELCENENVIYNPVVEKNEYGTPLVQDIFRQGWKYADNDDICIFVNGDIILTNSLCDTLEAFVEEYPNYNEINYFSSTIRFNWYNFKELNFEQPEDKWISDMKTNIKGEWHPPCGIDLFIHRKGTLDNIPVSGIAKRAYDTWILGHCNKYFDISINISETTPIYHQWGKWFQGNKVCDRNTETEETKKNFSSVIKCVQKEGLNKHNITDCKYISFFEQNKIKFKLK